MAWSKVTDVSIHRSVPDHMFKTATIEIHNANEASGFRAMADVPRPLEFAETISRLVAAKSGRRLARPLNEIWSGSGGEGGRDGEVRPRLGGERGDVAGVAHLSLDQRERLESLAGLSRTVSEVTSAFIDTLASLLARRTSRSTSPATVSSVGSPSAGELTDRRGVGPLGPWIDPSIHHDQASSAVKGRNGANSRCNTDNATDSVALADAAGPSPDVP